MLAETTSGTEGKKERHHLGAFSFNRGRFPGSQKANN
jgi:hypothetical protein